MRLIASCFPLKEPIIWSSILFPHVPTTITLGIAKTLLALVKPSNESGIFTRAKLKGTSMCLKGKKNPVLYRLQICFSNGSHISVPKSKDVIYQGTLSVDICIPLFASSQGFYVHMVEGEIRGSVGPLSWSSVFTGVLASLLHAEARASGDTYKATVLVTVSGYLS